ncbi:hypothetical protein [Kitasatospora phosalacinea]|uniref:hypothetical protein n=1 Tax=Kitasatospora phosalacinea TaxID=2065 RepID=UPI00068A86F6|nr:hypothetical protein [Kitasatospora phosalacinea]
MRNSTLKRAAALLIGAGALMAATIPAASANAAPKVDTSKAEVVKRALPKSVAPKQSRTAKSAAAATDPVVTPTYALLNPGAVLKSGTDLVVGNTTLSMQTDGNMVLYLNAGNGSHIQVLWSSKTWGNTGAYGVMQSDGNFVIYRAGGESAGAVWSTQTWNKPNSAFALYQGDLSVSDETTYYWESQTGFLPVRDAAGNYGETPSDILKNDQALFPNTWMESSTTVLVMQGDGNLVLYRKSDGKVIWSSNTWGHPGALAVLTDTGIFGVADQNNAYWYTNTSGNYGAYVKVQSDGNVVLYRAGGESAGAAWASNTWGKA